MKKLWTVLMAAMCMGMAQAQKTSVALTSGGDMESENTCVMVRNAVTGVQEIAVPEAGTGKNGTKGVSVTAQAGMDAAWNVGLIIAFNQAVYAEDVITVEFDYKATSPVTVRTQAHGEPGMYNYWNAIGNLSFTEEWQHFSGTVTVSSDMEGANGMKSIAIFVGQDASDNALAVPTTFYLDNVVVTGQVEEVTILSGKCGPNMTWTFNSRNKSLKIEGTGEMDKYYCNPRGDIYVTEAPWGRGNLNEIITDLEVGPGVTMISQEAFRGMTALKSATLPEGLTKLDYGAFWGTSLESINLPTTLTDLGRACFANCDLRSVVIPDGITTLPDALFLENKNLTSVTIPSSVSKIQWQCFEGCSSLESLELPSGLVFIDYWVCKDSGIKSIVLPEGLKHLGFSAFENTKLESITIPGSVENIEYDCFKDCQNLKSATIKNGLSTLPTGIFMGCKNLKSIVIPESVYRISQKAFEGCDALTEVSCLSMIPPKMYENPFDNYNKKVYVKIGAKDAYSADPIWGKFEIIEKDFDEWVDTHIEGDVNGDGVVDKDDLDKLVEILLKLKIEN